jgi:glyoxylase-like metal-dependent hydrolase (beta-lactamase superfamily II)
LIEEILPQLYRVRIPLPDSPLKYLNSYIIKGSSRALIIDTGFNREECLKAMTGALRQLGIDLNQTDLFITHLHADHIGLVGTLAGKTSKVYFNRIEVHEINTPNLWWERLNKFSGAYGFPKVELEKLFNAHPAAKYRLKSIPEFTILKDDDILEAGNYKFRCIETPGHSAGHLCLYEAKNKLLISGDHILDNITPNITTRFEAGINALGEYLLSLDKVYPLDVTLVLPGHRNLLTDMKKRIRDLKQHHEARTNEQLQILEKGNQDAYQVAIQMTWDMKYTDWETLPAFQKYFAFAEAVSHLQYLKSLGKVRENKLPDGKIVYSLV